MMPKFRKKPLVVEAIQWDGEGTSALPIAKMGGDRIRLDLVSQTLHLVTLEGVMTASIGDYIIKGIKGEIYPCKPDIFEATYEPVSDE